MTSIREFLASDPLATADAKLRYRESMMTRFSQYLPPDVADIWPRLFFRFVRLAPWRYWDTGIVERALEVLETSPERTWEAISVWSRQLGIGFDSLLKRAATSDHEESLDMAKTHDLLRLATEFHPEYLRCAQHVFANLLTPFWAVLKKGSVGGTFTLPGAISRIESKGHSYLLSGYDDNIRNAIAHGEVVFRGIEIQYGAEVANYRIPIFDFLAKFDSLWRTSNALAIALLLFIARNKQESPPTQSPFLPPSIIALIAAAGVERPGLTLLGIVESDYPSTGKQLHIAVQTVFLSCAATLLDCTRLAMHLLENGALGYSRYLFEVDCGNEPSSLVLVLPGRLAELLQQESPNEF